MLERVAVHQTRLRVPGVGLDVRGVALGSRGLVLLPSLDRLVAFFAVYTGEQALDGIARSLRIEVVRSKLGAREVALSFDAGSSDRMDRIAEVARLTGGFTFTGTSRHYVQYRDAAAPFGYDASEIIPTDAAIALYHTTFSQVYEVEREIELGNLLRRLSPHPDPEAIVEDLPVWLLSEPGLGPSLLGYLARSRVPARVGVVEWPPETSFDDAPLRRFLFQVEKLPERMRGPLSATPGITAFLPASPGVAIERGFRHPITLRSCPVFDEEGLVLFRGRGLPPLEIDKLPVLADVRSLGRAEQAPEDLALLRPGTGASSVPAIRLRPRLVPGFGPPGRVQASLIESDELPLLRRLVYALGADAIRSIRIAVTQIGAFLMREQGLEVLPLGTFFRREHPSIFVPSGYEVAPRVRPDTLFAAFGSPGDRILFLRPGEAPVAVPRDGFWPLESALLEAERWAPLTSASFESQLSAEIPTVWLDPLGFRPLSKAEPTS